MEGDREIKVSSGGGINKVRVERKKDGHRAEEYLVLVASLARLELFLLSLSLSG